MTNVTLAIPEDLHEKMKRHTEIRWSEVVRKSISQKIDMLDAMDRITRKSRLTDEDVALISRKIDGKVAKRLGL
jgi:hypothetical protein